MVITRRYGSWVVLGTLVTDVEIEASPPLDLDCGSCRLCVDACPTGALDHLPGRLPVEPRNRPAHRDARGMPRGSAPRSACSRRGNASRRACLADRLFVPRNDVRWLRRNALVAAGNVGGEREREAVARYTDSDDDVLRDHARWALRRMDERHVA